jgi:hypothetical protein
MKILVFTGPSLPVAEAAKELEATYLPPVSEGDIYRAVVGGPVAIGIVDGFFETVPSVWHKEILFALRQGIHVFGSASMGALRAAELAPFGMEGVGAIFEAYRDGLLEDDDEVAVVHGPAEIGYPLLSEAMVNIRRTLSDAYSADVIGEVTRAELEQIAKSTPYRNRTYAEVLRCADRFHLPKDELDQFRAWLLEGRYDQKREDALLMLRVMRERFRLGSDPKRVAFHFENTTLWEQAVQRAAERVDALTSR